MVKLRKLMMEKKLKILFLCTGNSCRSQMAEGWTRHLKGDIIDVYSAGVETHGLNPDAVKVMDEAGVDISSHSSKLISEFMDHLKTLGVQKVNTLVDWHDPVLSQFFSANQFIPSNTINLERRP